MAVAKTATARLVAIRRPAAGAARLSPPPHHVARADDWGWVPASRRKLLIDAKDSLGKRPKTNLLGAPFTLTPTTPVVADRAYFYGQTLHVLVTNPARAYFAFGGGSAPHAWGMFGFNALLPPHCAVLIDVPIRAHSVSSPLTLYVFAYNLVQGTSPVLEVIANQTITFAQPIPDPVHLGVLLSDVGPASPGNAAVVDFQVSVPSGAITFSFPSLTVTPL